MPAGSPQARAVALCNVILQVTSDLGFIISIKTMKFVDGIHVSLRYDLMLDLIHIDNDLKISHQLRQLIIVKSLVQKLKGHVALERTSWSITERL